MQFSGRGHKDAIMDLNQLPPEGCHELVHEYMDLSPLFCTQMFETNSNNGGCTFVHDKCPSLPMPSSFPMASEQCLSAQDATAAVDMPNPAGGVGSNPIGVVDASLATGVNSTTAAANENANEDETFENADENAEVSLQYLAAMSSPDDPYVGKTFETFEDARLFYNKYAEKLGFEIKNATSRRSAKTQQVEKVLFVCNKEGKGKKSKEEGENTIELPAPEHISADDDGSDVPKGAAKKKAPTGAKRKREKLKYKCCKARMQVKFDGMRWVVTNFVADHNHSLVDKPNLAKFMKSHSGIPDEEVQFLTLLHKCNIDTSRMMQLMSELYGSAQFVPYHTKYVSNLMSAIRSREGSNDMSQTIAYFYEMQKEQDPDFFFKVKLDADDKVENIFWVDGAAREAYKK